MQIAYLESIFDTGPLLDQILSFPDKGCRFWKPTERKDALGTIQRNRTVKKLHIVTFIKWRCLKMHLHLLKADTTNFPTSCIASMNDFL